MKAVILAANRSERLFPFTDTRAKPMIRVAGQYILQNTLESLREVGIREILVVVNHQKETIQDYFAYGDSLGVKLEYIHQDPVAGIGHALKLCEPFLETNEHFLLVYGDVLADGNIFQEALKTYYETGEQLAVVSLPKSSSEYGNVYLDHLMRIRRLIEKPQDGQRANYVFAGVFLLSSEIFKRLETHQNDMARVYQSLVNEKGLQATLWENGWMDIIYPWHILEANKMMMDRWQEARIHKSVELRGRVQIEGVVIIEENVQIESGTILKGPCFIGRDSYIGNNTLVREYSALGPNSVVGYGSELKNCVLFGGSDIGRLSFVGDSVVGHNVKLGSGVTTVNHWPKFEPVTVTFPNAKVDSGLTKLGAFIGDEVIIGARHTLAPGTIIAPGQVIEDNISYPPTLKGE